MDSQTCSDQTFVDAIERLIRLRTGSGIRGLRVDFVDGEVVLTGRTNTYYRKQLATHAAKDAVEEIQDGVVLRNEIEVY